MSRVLQSKKRRTETTTLRRRELPSTSTDHVLRITTSQVGVLFRCRRAAILRNIRRWEDIHHIRATWEHPTRDLPDPDTQEHHIRQQVIHTLEVTECNLVILRNVLMTIPVACTTANDLRG